MPPVEKRVKRIDQKAFCSRTRKIELPFGCALGDKSLKVHAVVSNSSKRNLSIRQIKILAWSTFERRTTSTSPNIYEANVLGHSRVADVASLIRAQYSASKHFVI